MGFGSLRGCSPPPVINKVFPAPLKPDAEGFRRGYGSRWYVFTGLGHDEKKSFGICDIVVRTEVDVDAK